MQLGLAGQRLARVLVDFDFYLEFGSGDTIVLSEFSIAASGDSNAETEAFGYANIASGASAVLPLIGAACTSAECDEKGGLYRHVRGRRENIGPEQ